jgi:hypothetical protein
MFNPINDKVLRSFEEVEGLYPDCYALLEIVEDNEDFYKIRGRVISVSDDIGENYAYLNSFNKDLDVIQVTGARILKRYMGVLD